MTLVRKNDAVRQTSKTYTQTLTLFPLSDGGERLCQNINKNLFHLEKNLAYFSFAIKEIKDITHST